MKPSVAKTGHTLRGCSRWTEAHDLAARCTHSPLDARVDFPRIAFMEEERSFCVEAVGQGIDPDTFQFHLEGRWLEVRGIRHLADGESEAFAKRVLLPFETLAESATFIHQNDRMLIRFAKGIEDDHLLRDAPVRN